MRVNGTMQVVASVVGCVLLLSPACSEHDARPPLSSDASAGASGELVGSAGTSAIEGGAAGVARDGAGHGGGPTAPTPGGASSEGGEAGERFVPGGAGSEAPGGASSTGGESGLSGANTGGDAAGPTATGGEGAAPSKVTTEQRALCESICAKEPLTNGFAGAPTAPCPDNENCAERTICHIADFFTTDSEFCTAAFTALLTCWDSLPDELYECGNEGLIPPDGCTKEGATMSAVCYR